ncbi:MAG: VOC family protein [Gammaproteobacteria bacterium]|nr:VOC family protein [Gammaproteobacteria bacterium]
MNLNQVTLPVRDLAIAIDFYQRLGFKLIVRSDQYARFECPEGDATFSLALDLDNFNNGATVYFESAELDHWVNELKARGISFAQEPTDERYLWREAILLDPSGNRIKLYWAGENRKNPPWKIKD